MVVEGFMGRRTPCGSGRATGMAGSSPGEIGRSRSARLRGNLDFDFHPRVGEPGDHHGGGGPRLAKPWRAPANGTQSAIRQDIAHADDVGEGTPL